MITIGFGLEAEAESVFFAFIWRKDDARMAAGQLLYTERTAPCSSRHDLCSHATFTPTTAHAMTRAGDQLGDLNLVNGARDCRAEVLRSDKRTADADDKRDALGRFCSMDSTKSTREMS